MTFLKMDTETVHFVCPENVVVGATKLAFRDTAYHPCNGEERENYLNTTMKSNVSWRIQVIMKVV